MWLKLNLGKSRRGGTGEALDAQRMESSPESQQQQLRLGSVGSQTHRFC